MKNTIRQLLRSGKFVAGFSIFAFLILTVVIFPMFVKDPPLGIIAQGTFFPPGIYVSVYDSLSSPAYTLDLKGAAKLRIASKLNEEDRQAVKEYLLAAGIPASEIDTADTAKLLEQWVNNYDPKRKIPGITNAKRNYYVRLNNSLKGLLATEGAVIAAKDTATGNLQQTGTVEQSAYVNVNEVANVRLLLLGTDNFGRDVMNEIVAGTRTSLLIGLVAGLIATTIGLILGLLAGYVGGTTDDVIMFITNIFTVIPSFIILILISYSIGQEARGPMTIAVLIGITSWVWTTRAVRSQVFSLRNRDHVNLSKISGHPLPRIILTGHPALHRLLCFYGVYSANLLRSPGRGCVIGPGIGPPNNRNANTGSDAELGADLPGADPWKMVGLPARGHYHRTDFVLSEPDEYRYGPGLQSNPAGVGDITWQK